MLSNLPCDLVDEILSRVPTKSFIRLRLTCKRWNSLFEEHRFAEKHFVNATKQNMCILFSDMRYGLEDLRIDKLPVSDLRIFMLSCELQRLGCYNVNRCELSLKDCHDKEKGKVFEVLHCDGLLLGITDNFKELIIWNPCLKQVKVTEPYNVETNCPGYAFGCDKKSGCRRYKILAFLQTCSKRGSCMKYCDVDMYDFTSNSWRVLNVKIDFFLAFPTRWISLKGNSYWIAADENTYEGFVVRFDFSTEMFGRLSLPFLAYPCDKHIPMSVKNDRIFILHQISQPYSVEIWMTGSVIDDQEVSWSKFMRIDEDKFDIRFNFPDFFVHDEENKVVVFCDKKEITNHRVCVIEEQRYTEAYVEEVGDFAFFSLHDYVPSLVHIR